MSLNRSILPVAVALALAACGGGGGGSSGTTTPDTTSGNNNTTTTTVPAADTIYPTEVVVATPASLVSAASAAQVSLPTVQASAREFLRTAWQAIRQRDFAALATLMTPLPKAMATNTVVPEADRIKAIIKGIADGTVSPTPHINWDAFFAEATDAPCFGPALPYAFHEDGAGANGTLPSGDLGMWISSDTPPASPCAAQQLAARTRAVMDRTQVALALGAGITKALRIPANVAKLLVDGTVDLRTAMQAVVNDANMNATVDATVVSGSLTSPAFRLRMHRDLERVEIRVAHNVGTDARNHSGIIQITVSGTTEDGARACADETVPGSSPTAYKVSQVTTIRYALAGTAAKFNSREGHYCGHGDSGQDNLASTIAELTAEGELDPMVTLSGNMRGQSKGWRGNFSRFAADYDTVTYAGSFVYAWQAGAQDSHSRMFAARTLYENIAQVRQLMAFYGFSNPVQTTDGRVQGMICNWAGPGATRTLQPYFQSQTMELFPGDSGWGQAGTSYTTYAPTNSCNSTTTVFDQNRNGMLETNEGLSTNNHLDTVFSGTVPDRIGSLGYNVPSIF